MLQQFVHQFVPAPGRTTKANADAATVARADGAAEAAPAMGASGVPTGAAEPHPLLLLHGTGGDENQLLGLGRALAPEAAQLSPRGRVSENGMARFFRRVAEGVFDMEDLFARTHELASFITEARDAYELTGARFVAVGFSNGANIAGSLLLTYPELFAGAVLYRPMVPFVPEVMPDLRHVSVLVVPGEQDPLVPQEESQRLIELLERAGAAVEAPWQPGGHALTEEDVAIARQWMDAL